MKIQDPVIVLFHGAQSESQNAIHEIKRVSLDVESSMGRIGVKQLVSDSPRVEIAMIVDEQSESGHVGYIDVRFVAFIVANIDRECDE